jgi:hypothetical protein
MTTYRIKDESTTDRVLKMYNSSGKYAFGKAEHGTQESYNRDQSLSILALLSGQEVSRKTLLAMLTLQFKGTPKALKVKPSYMILWCRENGMIEVI